MDDTILALEVLRRVLDNVPEHTLIWMAQDGAEALQKCAENPPDLILMDLVMPVMNGVEATRRIMEKYPCAILLVTVSTTSNLSMVYEAMGHGALDAVNTPVFTPEGDLSGAEPLLDKIRTAAKLLGVSQSIPATRSPAPKLIRRAHQSPPPPLVAIGSSTGGPQALSRVFRNLPRDFNTGILVAQHVDVEFAPGLVQWLRSLTPLHVELARESQAPTTGKILIAGTNDHMVVTANRNLAYTRHPLEYFYRPSADELFHSLARHWPTPGVAVLLTGMGRDGARGLLALRQAGWHTIAQDEKSCVVYGMPKEAADLNAACRILPLDRIGEAIADGLKSPANPKRGKA